MGQKELLLKCGDLVVMVTEHVHVTVVITTQVLVEDITTLKLLM
jgi:hypothetical protein